MDTQTLVGVPILDVGTWSGKTYTGADLDAMVAAFAELKGTVDPPVKLGRDEGQRVLEQEGYPAVGSVERLYRKGTRLVADISRVPKTLAELIDAGTYQKTSIEIWSDVDVGGKRFSNVVAGVAFLGEDLPAGRDIVALSGGTLQHTRALNPIAATSSVSHRSVTFAARPAPQKEHHMPTTADAPTGIRAVITSLGLAPNVSADDVMSMVARTPADASSMLAVRRTLGLAPSADKAEIVGALRTRLTYRSSGKAPQLVFTDRHDVAPRAQLSMSAPILTALGLPANATPADVSMALDKIRQAQKKAGDKANEETSMMDAVRALVGLDASASDDDVAEAVRKLLESPEIIDNAIKARRLTPALRGWAENLAAKQGVAALRTFVAASGPYDVRADEILADLAHERVRWSRGRVDFSAAMTEVARAHPELARAYLARR